MRRLISTLLCIPGVFQWRRRRVIRRPASAMTTRATGMSIGWICVTISSDRCPGREWQ
jgi:hypothetical protein